MEGCRFFGGVSRIEAAGFVTFDATDLAAEMLSRATSVTGAALDTLAMEDQDPEYQLYKDDRLSVNITWQKDWLFWSQRAYGIVPS